MIARKPKLCEGCSAEYRGFIADSLRMVRLEIRALEAEAAQIAEYLRGRN